MIGAKQKKEKKKNLEDAKDIPTYLIWLWNKTFFNAFSIFKYLSSKCNMLKKMPSYMIFSSTEDTCPHDIIYIYFQELGYVQFIGWFLLGYCKT